MLPATVSMTTRPAVHHLSLSPKTNTSMRLLEVLVVILTGDGAQYLKRADHSCPVVLAGPALRRPVLLQQPEARPHSKAFGQVAQVAIASDVVFLASIGDAGGSPRPDLPLATTGHTVAIDEGLIGACHLLDYLTIIAVGLTYLILIGALH